MTLVSQFIEDQSGGTAIEYGLIAAGIAVAIIAALNAMGLALVAKFNTIATALK
jgi:pilus assembly protein Flp/PilA